MESLWYIEYDQVSTETDFFKINFTALLEQAVSDPDALSLAQLYNFSNNKFEHTLQKYLSEFLEVFKNFFQDLLEISENENLLTFSKSVLIYIQVERLYFLSYWRIFAVENFVLNRLLSSYIRIKNLLTSFHLNCFPKLYRSKELGEAASGPRHKKRFSLTKTDQGTYDLLFKRSEELKFFQNYLCTAFESIIKESKKQKNGSIENISNFFKKTLHYSKNIINKNAYYLKQENENLFGNVAEKALAERILSENKSKMDLVRKEIEKERSFEDRLKRNKNTTCVKFDQNLQIFSNNVNPFYQKEREKSCEVENQVLQDIVRETESIHRKVSIKLTDKPEKTPSVSFSEESKKKESKSEKKIPTSLRSKGIIPPPPPMNQAMKAREKILEDPLIKESIMKSLTNYFQREETHKQPGKLESSMTRETLFKIKSNITDVIDERKINKYKSMNEIINSNLENLINELAAKKRNLTEAYQKMQLENSDLFSRESKALSTFIPQKHHSIEMVAGSKFTESKFTDSYETPPKYSNFRNISINESIDEHRINHKSKISELNVIRENEEPDLKDHKGSQLSVQTNTFRANTTLTSPLLRTSHENSNAFSNIWNFFRKSIKPFSSSQRLPLKAGTTIMNSRVNKLNVSEKDIIKIDSNTEINEELKFVRTVERQTQDMVRDEELFRNEYLKSLNFLCRKGVFRGR